MTITLYCAMAVAVIASIAAITRRHALHAILWLIGSFVAIAVVFYVVGAPFIAALEIITYAGAIMVMFLFAVMLLNLGKQAVEQERQWQPLALWVGPSVIALILCGEFVYLFSHGIAVPLRGSVVSPVDIGRQLLGPYIIGVELTALLLLAALLGAYHIGRPNRSAPVGKEDGHGNGSL